MFKAKKELEALKIQYDRLQEKFEECQVENEILQEHLNKISKGERCEGEYCESCKHAVEGVSYEYKTASGIIIRIEGNKILCALDVPCPDYEREE